VKTIEDLRDALSAADPEVRAIAKMIADGLLTIVTSQKGNPVLTWTPAGEIWFAEIKAIAEHQALAEAHETAEVVE